MAITYSERYKTAEIATKFGDPISVVDGPTFKDATSVIRSALRKEQLRFYTEEDSPEGTIKLLTIIPWHFVTEVRYGLGDPTTVEQVTCFSDDEEGGGR